MKSNLPITPEQFSKLIKKLPHNEIYTRKLNLKLNIDPNYSKVWYTCQKEHLLGWVSESRGKGAYNRKRGHKTAESVYIRIQCEPMLFWLAEACGISNKILLKTISLIKRSNHYSKNCGIIRSNIPWPEIEKALLKTNS